MAAWLNSVGGCDGGAKRDGEAELGCLLLALDMVALSTCVRVGLIPHARHGGKGVWAFAVVGSKLDGTGFGKLQMVHIQVAVLACVGATDGERIAVSTVGEGDAPVVPEGPGVVDAARGWRGPRLVGLGKSVTFGEDLRKPACAVLKW